MNCSLDVLGYPASDPFLVCNSDGKYEFTEKFYHWLRQLAFEDGVYNEETEEIDWDNWTWWKER